MGVNSGSLRCTTRNTKPKLLQFCCERQPYNRGSWKTRKWNFNASNRANFKNTESVCLFRVGKFSCAIKTNEINRQPPTFDEESLNNFVMGQDHQDRIGFMYTISNFKGKNFCFCGPH